MPCFEIIVRPFFATLSRHPLSLVYSLAYDKTSHSSVLSIGRGNTWPPIERVSLCWMSRDSFGCTCILRARYFNDAAILFIDGRRSTDIGSSVSCTLYGWYVIKSNYSRSQKASPLAPSGWRTRPHPCPYSPPPCSSKLDVFPRSLVLLL